MPSSEIEELKSTVDRLERELAALTAAIGRMAAYLGVAHLVNEPTV